MPGLKLGRARRSHVGMVREAEYAVEAPVFADTEEASGGEQVFGAASRRFITAGIANSDFGDPPEDLTQPIDNDNNPLPDWSFVRASGTSIDATVVADSGSASGYVIQWTMREGAAGDDAYIEQVVPVNGSRSRQWSYMAVASFLAGASVDASEVYCTAQYLKSDQITTTGTEYTSSRTLTAIGANGTTDRQATPNDSYAVPADAYYVRIRIGYRRASLGVGSSGVGVTLTEVFELVGPQLFLLTDFGSPGTQRSGRIYQNGGLISIVPANPGAGASIPSFSVGSNGTVNAAGGGAAVNTTLQLLATSGQRSSISVGIDGESSRVAIYGDATLTGIEFGSGSGATDWRLSRTAASVAALATGDTLKLDNILLTGVISPAQITTNTDDYAPAGGSTAFMWRVSSDAARNLTGLSVSQAQGDAKMLANIGAFNITLVHDATSTAANRFYCPNSANLALRPNGFVLVIYDATSARWRVMGA